MEIIGRLTADATVATISGDRQVVNFNIAINDYYRPKGSTETKKLTTFISCAYWISTKVADRLKKGALVQLGGRLGVAAYSVAGEPRAKITLHVNTVKIHPVKSAPPAAASTAVSASVADDLPF
ncbi:single-strand DNA-binding protein [Chitinophaga eiseniae]|uniref:Single-strand DNA-binding protein n=1 Tax=Chitinophaga eiseniae TaxID=634771 RepID=A0A1T4MLW1_9BACT|nr:single-stranded DNA-binding protein [Chitinophaga eiseniae]SJZ67806.1 single-strand DNA-binding protein [Chitinophaga eiseniae]